MMMYTDIATFYDLIYTSRKDYAAEAAQLHALIQTHKRSSGQRLLDVACGTGLHLAQLQAYYTAEGLDLTPAMLELARQRCPGLPLHVGDMRTFDLGQRFDVVTCLFSSVGHLPTPADLTQAVSAMARALVPGGVLIYEPFITPEQMRDRYFSGEVHRDDERLISRVSYTRVEGRNASIDFHHLLASAEGVRYVLEQDTLYLFTVEENLAACRAAGLQVTHDPQGLTGRGLYIGLK